MFNKKLIGAILVNYNDSERTVIQVQRLLSFNFFDKIIVVDNNSNLTNKEKLSVLKSPNVSVFLNSKNKGYGAGNNVGLNYLSKEKYDFVLLINNDIIIEKDSILSCVQFLIENKSFAVSTPLMIEKGKIKRNFYDIPTFCNTLNFISSTFSKKCKSMEINENYICAEYVRESATIYNLNYFKKIGFFDENFFMYEEGPSTGFLFKKLGLKEAVITSTKPYIHNHKGPLINRKLFAINKKSRLYFFKNYQKYGKLKLLIFRLYWLNIFLR